MKGLAHILFGLFTVSSGFRCLTPLHRVAQFIKSRNNVAGIYYLIHKSDSICTTEDTILQLTLIYFDLSRTGSVGGNVH